MGEPGGDPTAERLVADLYDRTERAERRARVAWIVAGVAIVVALVAGGVAVSRGSGSGSPPVASGGTTVVPKTGTTRPARPSANSPDPAEISTVEPSERNVTFADFVAATVELRGALLEESLESAVYASSNKQEGKDELARLRDATDDARATYADASKALTDSPFEGVQTRDAMKQADARLKNLETIRKAVDAIQADPAKLVDDYWLTYTDIAGVHRSLIHDADDLAMHRLLLQTSYLSEVTDEEGHTAGLLAIAATIGFYAAVLPTGSNPTPERNNGLGDGCGDDASKDLENCRLFADVLDANQRVGLAEQSFHEFATGEQKQVKRFADAGSRYDELKRIAIEDGTGHNDLTGQTTGTGAVDRDEFVAAAHERFTKLIAAEHQILDDALRR